MEARFPGLYSMMKPPRTPFLQVVWLTKYPQISWAGNNLAPSSRRAVGLALNICIGNAGGVMGSYMFFDSDAPSYRTGFGLSLAFGITGLLAAVAAELSYKRANNKRDKIPEEETRARYSQDQLVAMGDKSPLFRYTL